MTEEPGLTEPVMTRVAVIGGGQSCEHEVSLASAASVARALEPAHEVVRLTIGTDGSWRSADGDDLGLDGAIAVLRSCDVVFPAVHGPLGEDGALAALCELAGVPYVGSGLRAGALAMDKWATKLVAEEVGVRTARGTLVTAATVGSVSWDGPVVVKPVAAGSSHGVALVEHPAGLAPALAAALALDERALVEEALVGREIDIAVLAGPGGSRTTGPALEIVADGLFDTGTKYDGSAEFLLPAPLDVAELKELEDAAVTVFDALGCGGVARVDFFLTSEGWVLNEVNTMPGMTEQSQVPKMFAEAGLPYPDLLARLVAEAR